MMPLCLDEGIGAIPWSPLARGRLTREPGAVTARTADDGFGERLYGATADADARIVAEVARIAGVRGVSRAQIALAWLLGKPGVVAPIVGATKPQHLVDAVAAVDLVLTDEEIAALESPYVPHPITGH